MSVAQGKTYHSGWNILRFIKMFESSPKTYGALEYKGYKFETINLSQEPGEFVFLVPTAGKPASIISHLMGCVRTKYWMDVFLVERRRVLAIEEMKPLTMPQEELNIMHRLKMGEPRR